MQISSINNQAFQAKLEQNPIIMRNHTKKFLGKREAIATYDQAINELYRVRSTAKQLHQFMETPEMKNMLERFPEGDAVELSTKLNYEEDLNGNLKLSQPSLCYGFDSDDSVELLNRKFGNDYEKIGDLELLEVSTDEDGKLNKDEIRSWFKRIADIFNS